MAPGQRSITAPEGVIHHFPSDGGERGIENETSEGVDDGAGEMWRGLESKKVQGDREERRRKR